MLRKINLINNQDFLPIPINLKPEIKKKMQIFNMMMLHIITKFKNKENKENKENKINQENQENKENQ
jgi:hypothetical protein